MAAEQGEGQIGIVSSLCFKTAMCKFHLRGMCKKGSACKFAHSWAEMQPLPDFRKTRMCPKLMYEGKCGNSACKFAHRREQLRKSFEETVTCEEEAIEHTYSHTWACGQSSGDAMLDPPMLQEQSEHPRFAHRAVQQQQQQPLAQQSPASMPRATATDARIAYAAASPGVHHAADRSAAETSSHVPCSAPIPPQPFHAVWGPQQQTSHQRSAWQPGNPSRSSQQPHGYPARARRQHEYPSQGAGPAPNQVPYVSGPNFARPPLSRSSWAHGVQGATGIASPEARGEHGTWSAGFGNSPLGPDGATDGCFGETASTRAATPSWEDQVAISRARSRHNTWSAGTGKGGALGKGGGGVADFPFGETVSTRAATAMTTRAPASMESSAPEPADQDWQAGQECRSLARLSWRWDEQEASSSPVAPEPEQDATEVEWLRLLEQVGMDEGTGLLAESRELVQEGGRGMVLEEGDGMLQNGNQTLKDAPESLRGIVGHTNVFLGGSINMLGHGNRMSEEGNRALEGVEGTVKDAPESLRGLVGHANVFLDGGISMLEHNSRTPAESSRALEEVNGTLEDAPKSLRGVVGHASAFLDGGIDTLVHGGRMPAGGGYAGTLEKLLVADALGSLRGAVGPANVFLDGGIDMLEHGNRMPAAGSRASEGVNGQMEDVPASLQGVVGHADAFLDGGSDMLEQSNRSRALEAVNGQWEDAQENSQDEGTLVVRHTFLEVVTPPDTEGSTPRRAHSAPLRGSRRNPK